MSNGSNKNYVKDVVLAVVFYAGLLYTVNHVFTKFSKLAAHDPDKEQQEQNMLKATTHLRKLERSRQAGEGYPDSDSEKTAEGAQRSIRKEDLVLDQYESLVAMEVVAAEDIPVGFDDIGGLEDIIQELQESVIYPLTMPHLYAHGSSLLSAPSGVLLYGPPGCGKTMLAKGLAKESGATFINLHISTLTEKWYGDSNKLVRAVFSLARKLQPCIVFIDEIDAVLGTRRSGEHEASGMVKAEFMTLWDGLTSADNKGAPARIMVLGATNRIQDIDEAILRRMPKKFPIALPSNHQRRRILNLVLKGTKIDSDHFDIEYLSRVMAGMSGSDIKEACRDAAMVPVREFIREQKARGASMAGVKNEDVRGIKTEDFFGTKGGRQILGENHRQHSSKHKQQKSSNSSDEYEDIEDGPVPVSMD